MDVVALRVKLYRKKRTRRGREMVVNDYPDFNAVVSPESRTIHGSPVDWSHYVTQAGLGWMYDELSGFGFVDGENADPGMLYGVICVPEAFALEAASGFPERCEILTHDDFLAWHERRIASQMSDVIYDSDHLSGLHAALSLAKEVETSSTAHGNLVAEARRALDPDSGSPGVRRNDRRDIQATIARRGLKLKGGPGA
jgi:hypothetical protein